MSSPLRVLIVSENISMKMGGESSLPFYYARLLAKRGVEVWLACHERVAKEVNESFPDLAARTCLVRDTDAQKLVFTYGSHLPYRIRDLFVGQAIHWSTQARIGKIARELASAGKIDVVLEPAPITPKGLSFMYNLGVPVVIGPLCGGMVFPPAFQNLDSFVTRLSVEMGRRVSELANRLVPGKRQADVLLVANENTAKALPKGCQGRVIRLFESGVDLDLWGSPSPSAADEAQVGRGVSFVFSGRFVDWKGIQYLVRAFKKALAQEPTCELHLIGGGGDLTSEIEAMVADPMIANRVRTHGWMSREAAASIIRDANVFVMPSLRECGGTAILEAMALGKPIITTNWGGPADYVDATCGILVDPDSPDAFVDGLATAMVKLARSPELRRQLGEGGRKRVRTDFLDWESKADRILAILREVAKKDGPQ